MQVSEEQADAILEAYDRVRAELSAVWADQQKLVAHTMPTQAASTNLMVDHVRYTVAPLAFLCETPLRSPALNKTLASASAS